MKWSRFSALNSTGSFRSETSSSNCSVPYSLDEVVEVLALVPLLLVVADPALDRVGDPLRGQARLEPVAEGDFAALVAPPMADVGGIAWSPTLIEAP